MYVHVVILHIAIAGIAKKYSIAYNKTFIYCISSNICSNRLEAPGISKLNG